MIHCGDPRRCGVHTSGGTQTSPSLSVRGRSADAETPESWAVVQSVRAAAMEKTRVQVKCMMKVTKFCGRARLILLREREMREQLDWRNTEGQRAKFYSTGYPWWLTDNQPFSPF